MKGGRTDVTTEAFLDQIQVSHAASDMSLQPPEMITIASSSASQQIGIWKVHESPSQARLVCVSGAISWYL